MQDTFFLYLQILEAVKSKLSEDAKIIWGVQIDKSLGDTVRTLLVVTGVTSPQIFGAERKVSKEYKKSIEKALNIEFIS